LNAISQTISQRLNVNSLGHTKQRRKRDSFIFSASDIIKLITNKCEGKTIVDGNNKKKPP